MAEAMTREEAIEGLRGILAKGSPSEVVPYARVLIGDRWPKLEDLPHNPTPKDLVDFYWRAEAAMAELQSILDEES